MPFIKEALTPQERQRTSRFETEQTLSLPQPLTPRGTPLYARRQQTPASGQDNAALAKTQRTRETARMTIVWSVCGEAASLTMLYFAVPKIVTVGMMGAGLFFSWPAFGFAVGAAILAYLCARGIIWGFKTHARNPWPKGAERF